MTYSKIPIRSVPPLRSALPPGSAAIPALVMTILALSVATIEGIAAQPQQEAELRGLVVDSVAGEPLEGILVRMDTGPETLSGRDGRFRLRGLAPGPHMLVLLSPDCRVTWAEVELEAGSVAEARFRVPRVPTTEEREAREDRRRSQGEVVTAADIEEMRGVRSLAEVIRRVAPNMVGNPGIATGGAVAIRGRSTSSFMQDGNEPVVVVDGVRAAHASRAIDAIDPMDVARLEIKAGAAAGWEYGSDGAAGVIVIETWRGRPRATRPAAETCVVPDFPVG